MSHADLPVVAEAIISVLLVVGAFFGFLGSLGLLKLRDFYSRLHTPTKGTTLGVGAILIASSIYHTVTSGSLSLHEVLVTFFLFITAPVGAHLLSRAAVKQGIPNVSGAPERDAKDAD
jgi:multicomponent K+:H+ antiporter subunit G